MSMAGAHENTPSDKGVFHVSGPSTPAKLPLPEQVPPQNPKSKGVGRTPPPYGTVKAHGRGWTQADGKNWGRQKYPDPEAKFLEQSYLCHFLVVWP